MNRFEFPAVRFLSAFQLMVLRIMRQCTVGLALVAGLAVLSVLPAHAQNKTACQLLSKADAETVAGVPLTQQPDVGSRTLLDPKNSVTGTIDQACTLTGSANDLNPVRIRIEVRYSSTPDAHAPDRIRKYVDEHGYEDLTDVPDLGDAAFWFGQGTDPRLPIDLTLYVFRGGTVGLMIFCNKGLEKEEALALKVLANLGGTSGYVYGDQPALKKPVLSQLGPKPSAVDQLKHDLAARADAGDAKVQLALGRLYQYATLAPDGTPKPDYAAAAFWYQKASDHGEAQASYALAIIYRDGLGTPKNPAVSMNLLTKAAEAGYVPAMVPLSYAYAAMRTPTSRYRANLWASKSADSGDSQGLLARGDLYKAGILGAERSVWPVEAMYEYKKSADKGNCVAMLNIGTLYLNGEGVIQDKSQAQTWFSKAEVCEGGDLDSIRQKATEYRDKVVAGAGPLFGEIPIPAKGGTGLSDGQKLLVGVAALFALSMAMDCSKTQQPCTGNGEDGIAGIIQNQQNLAHVDCVQRFGLGGLC